MSKITPLNVVIPPWSSQAAAERDKAINKLITALGVQGDFYKYVDVGSGWGTWIYYWLAYVYIDGNLTAATVTCSGMTHPPSGSDTAAIVDAGVGVNTWVAVGTLPKIMISGGNGGVAAPAQNAGNNVWSVPGSSSTAAADFTKAINVINTMMSPNAVPVNYLKYVDSVSGAWKVYALWVSPGFAVFGAASQVQALTSNVVYMVTCSGTPNPPSGSGIPPVAIPAFTQAFTSIGSPLSFGPMR